MVVTAAGSTPTFLIFAGVGVPPNRLLDGVCLAVPYSISSCVCLVFFICCFKQIKTKCSFTHSSNGKVSVKSVTSLTLSSFSFSFSLWCRSHCCFTYSRNCCPLTWNSVPCSCSHMSIWAFRHFSSWNKDETQMLAEIDLHAGGQNTSTAHPDLGQTLLQVSSLLLFFEKVPTSVVEP